VILQQRLETLLQQPGSRRSASAGGRPGTTAPGRRFQLGSSGRGCLPPRSERRRGRSLATASPRRPHSPSAHKTPGNPTAEVRELTTQPRAHQVSTRRPRIPPPSSFWCASAAWCAGSVSATGVLSTPASTRSRSSSRTSWRVVWSETTTGCQVMPRSAPPLYQRGVAMDPPSRTAGTMRSCSAAQSTRPRCQAPAWVDRGVQPPEGSQLFDGQRGLG
jgi:hypothetical protein